jgi:hypothetical protein
MIGLNNLNYNLSPWIVEYSFLFQLSDVAEGTIVREIN